MFRRGPNVRGRVWTRTLSGFWIREPLVLPGFLNERKVGPVDLSSERGSVSSARDHQPGFKVHLGPPLKHELRARTRTNVRFWVGSGRRNRAGLPVCVALRRETSVRSGWTARVRLTGYVTRFTHAQTVRFLLSLHSSSVVSV